MTKAVPAADDADDPALLRLFIAIATSDDTGITQALQRTPRLATRALGTGASRDAPKPYFLSAIHHYVYAGDTALHVAAAAAHRELAALLVERGADVRARNRRGAEPIHYAADGSPGAGFRDASRRCSAVTWPAGEAQRAVIALLVRAGADPNALDKSGVAPLHRAVRTRTADAARSLIDNGADPRLMNKSGSTPLHLAVQNTGKSNSGSDAAKEQQRRIILLLLARGARPTDADSKGKTVAAAATSEWIRQLLDAG